MARHAIVGFSIGSKGYLGTGDGSQEFWEYDTTSNTWTQKADYGGVGVQFAAGFSIGNKGYMGTGFSGFSYPKDFWEYDPAVNIWTQKADFGGAGRRAAVGFSIGSKGYIGTGYTGSQYKQDFWEYDTAGNTWTQKADFGGPARRSAVGFSIGSKGYIGTGYASWYREQDFWEYDPSTNTWTQKVDFGGGGRDKAVGFSIGSKGYIGTGDDCGGCYLKDFWEYDPGTNTWTQKEDFGGSGRHWATGFSIGSKGYIGTGKEAVGSSKVDFWEYLGDALTPTISASGSIIFCTGDSVILTSSPAASYFWSTGDTAQSITVVFSGSYTITITDVNGLCATSTPTSVTVNSLPSVSITGLDTSYCLNDAAIILTGTPSSGIFSGTGISGNQFNPANAGIGTHTITYSYTDGNGCTNSVSQNVSVNNCTGIANINFIKSINIYPNPNTGEFIIEMDISKSQDIQLRMFNILGQEIFTENIINVKGKYSKQINLNKHSTGIYNVQLLINPAYRTGRQEIINKKIILEK